MPHLTRALSAYKGLQICSFYYTRAHTHVHPPPTHTHTHTANTCITGVGWQGEKKEKDKSVCRREEVGFEF